ncbi:MAG: hypothetical protein FWE31_05450 [Firmicutes bacterium]|nr:hypothetical protein [Bacillota bacterium]
MVGLVFLIISSIIGAGFATGAEILVFFGDSSLPSWAIGLVTTACLFLLMLIIIWLNERGFSPPKVIFVPLYFAFLVAMTAGISSLINPLAAIIALGACILIVMYGFEKLAKFNKYLIAFVLTVILIVTILSIGHASVSIPPARQSHGLFRTVWSALIYAGMNMLIFPIIKQSRTRFSFKKMITATMIASAILGLLVFLLVSTLRGREDLSFPILQLSDSFLILVMIFLCIFSSQFIHLFNLDTETTRTNATNGRLLKLAIICAVAFFLSSFGFTKIIGFVYPIIGIFMIIFLMISCGWSLISRRIPRR